MYLSRTLISILSTYITLNIDDVPVYYSFNNRIGRGRVSEWRSALLSPYVSHLAAGLVHQTPFSLPHNPFFPSPVPSILVLHLLHKYMGICYYCYQLLESLLSIALCWEVWGRPLLSLLSDWLRGFGWDSDMGDFVNTPRRTVFHLQKGLQREREKGTACWVSGGLR